MSRQSSDQANTSTTLTGEHARAIAETIWPGVLNVDELSPGLFSIVSTDHGGMLAAVQDLTTRYGVTADAVRVAEAFDLVRRITFGGLSTQVWVGEEDIDWRTLVCSSPAVHAAWVEHHRRPGNLPPDLPFQVWLQQWAPLARLQAELAFWRPSYPQALPSPEVATASGNLR